VSEAEVSPSRQRILDCAARLFRQRGYGATSLRDIAAASGMKAGSLYYYFASKDEIVIDVLNIGVSRVTEAVQRAVSNLPSDARVGDVIDVSIHEHLRALHEVGNYTSANVRIFGQVPDLVRAAHKPTRRIYEEYWDALLTRAVKSGELHANADSHLMMALLISSLNSTLEWFDSTKGPVDQVAAAFSAMVRRSATAD
jgi:AcrR family transcriptional regulator